MHGGNDGGNDGGGDGGSGSSSGTGDSNQRHCTSTGDARVQSCKAKLKSLSATLFIFDAIDQPFATIVTWSTLVTEYHFYQDNYIYLVNPGGGGKEGNAPGAKKGRLWCGNLGRPLRMEILKVTLGGCYQ